ncbi:STAS domain-containing protein [Spirochaeta isovalerica]|uniref:Anti-anti-sigma factor n=1 Tax=Spirochaeta isovalerica TaxID=150 RepID=A0A841R8Q9_9SPIO|nr:STAS domain-containing protein [Spirochaeta isovalerica]MBB6480186.1 anti-anti-sigma factor [Spirochaeta isovalerica]
MSIRENRTGDTVELVVDSLSLAGDEATALKEKAVELIDSGQIKLSLNLTKPEYIDSSGIGKLLFMNKKIEKLGGDFRISAINSTLYDFLESLAITKVMDIASP